MTATIHRMPMTPLPHLLVEAARAQPRHALALTSQAAQMARYYARAATQCSAIADGTHVVDSMSDIFDRLAQGGTTKKTTELVHLAMAASR